MEASGKNHLVYVTVVFSFSSWKEVWVRLRRLKEEEVHVGFRPSRRDLLNRTALYCGTVDLSERSLVLHYNGSHDTATRENRLSLPAETQSQRMILFRLCLGYYTIMITAPGVRLLCLPLDIVAKTTRIAPASYRARTRGQDEECMTVQSKHCYLPLACRPI